MTRHRRDAPFHLREAIRKLDGVQQSVAWIKYRYHGEKIAREYVGEAKQKGNEMIKWRNMKTEKPEDGQECLTTMKHGMIAGMYNASDGDFSVYMWQDLTWGAYQWVPIEEVAPSQEAKP